ncbi:MAG: aminopeptidase N [Bifidobacteriaceae bacterium]|nr:aminopeptidase N [Bifidobacteriaceae bacterium]
MNLTQAEARARAALIANPRYTVELDLTGDGTLFGSTTTVQFESREAGAVTFIELVAPEVLQATLNGRPLDVAQAFAEDRLKLEDLQPENTLVVEARCAYSHTGEGLHRFTDPVDNNVYLYTQFEPADSCRVFAVFEQPDLKGTFEFRVKAPAGWKVLSNQPLAQAPVVEGAEGVWHRFEPTPKLSSYLTAVAAGPYAEWRGEVESADGRAVPLGLYARQSMAEFVDAENVFDVTRRGFAFYEPAFGRPYPFTKYDQVFCPEYNFGAMENAGLVTITERYVFRSKPVEATVERRVVTILHELAHMWFGDLVTMRWWDDLWLNESFAEFVSHLAAVEATQWTDAWATFSWSEKMWAYQQDQLPTTHPIVAQIPDTDSIHNNFDGITYAKGASVLRQLVAWVGQDAFLEGVRAYIAKHAWGNTELRDLLVELEAAAGRDLGEWADKWLMTTGVNLISADLAEPLPDAVRYAPPVPAATGAGAGDVSGTAAAAQDTGKLVQTGAPGDLAWRPQRIGLGGYSLTDGALTRFWDTEIDLTGLATRLPKIRQADLLLVNDMDLAYAKVRLDPSSLGQASEHLGEIGDPLARAVVWGVLWDMTRDAELGARRFVDLELRWLAAETNSTGMQLLLRQAETALERYTAPEFRLAASERAAERLWELATLAAPGQDAQLQLVRAYARHATTGTQLDRVDELETGARSLTGLEMDADLRWDLLFALVAAGRAGEDRIDAQLAADRTHSGMEQAAGLRAALPTPEAKAAAWLRAVEDPATPNATQLKIIAGWGRVKDPSLLAPFVEPYFAALPRIWRERSIQIASNVAQGLYPAAAADVPGVDVPGATDRFLAELGGDLPPLRRIVVEGKAGVVRALAAEAADRTAGGPEALT